MKPISILFLFFLIVGFELNAQQTDTTLHINTKKEYRNTFKWNITPQLLWGGSNLVFGWERKLSSHRSFSINIGHLQFPTLIGEESKLVNIISSSKNTGFSFAFDYRFYAKKRNKKEAPDGLYWAPFFVSYNYNMINEIHLLDDNSVIIGTAELESKINAFNLGVELGYQFVFKERFVFDMVLIGPAAGFYKAKFDLSGDIQGNNQHLQTIKDILANRIPLLGKLLENSTVETNGNLSAFKPGFRYLLQVGYRF